LWQQSDSKVIGTGGYGCVLYPARVFDNSVVITANNRHHFVTKLSRDAEVEYDVAMFCKTKIPTFGIFPVDSLHCGVNLAEIGRNVDTILSECGTDTMGEPYSAEPLDRYNGILLRRQFKELYKSLDESRIPDYIGPVNLKPLQRQLYRRKEGLLCAVQYPKYLMDFGTSEYMAKTEVEKSKHFMTLVENMTMMHHQHIYHLDVKPPNLCLLTKDDPRFADWGLSIYLSPTMTNTEAHEILASIIPFLSYYFSLFD
jgi:serine/threonine protein kinase